MLTASTSKAVWIHLRPCWCCENYEFSPNSTLWNRNVLFRGLESFKNHETWHTPSRWIGFKFLRDLFISVANWLCSTIYKCSTEAALTPHNMRHTCYETCKQVSWSHINPTLTAPPSGNREYAVGDNYYSMKIIFSLVGPLIIFNTVTYRYPVFFIAT